MRFRFYLMTAMSCYYVLLSAQQKACYDIIPQPLNVEEKTGEAFVINAQTSVYCDREGLSREADFLVEYIKHKTGIQLVKSARKEKSNQIQLSVKNEKNANMIWPQQSGEDYKLTVDKNIICIEGNGSAGVFYGIQSLRKSLPVAKGTVELSPVVITDSPRFVYRGMHLDCSRHFFDIEFVKEYIDILAFHNMNVFHWHLSDDQGWRIEMKRHPRLTEIGAWRSGTVLGHNSDLDDSIPHGGFYTQEQAREIVRYAQERHITVMPEIDLPGHTKAVLASYPELGCTGGPYEVGHRWGVYADVLCMGNPKCYDLVRDIIDELTDIFPSKYIHIGGDETPTVRWEACPKCNAIDRKGMTYQGYFTHQIVPYLEAKGRRAIGWDEILYTGADTNTAIMSWRGSDPGAEAAAKGHDVVMAPTSHCYFDYQQSKDVIHEPDNSDGGYIPVDKVYSLDPVPAKVKDETRKHILGVQANAWAEHLRTTGMVEYMTLPRMAALSEVAWTQPEKKDYKDFVRRVTRLTEDYESYHWQYAKHLWPERRNNQALE